MSQRHRSAEAPSPAKQEVRAHAHGERRRIQVELNAVANQVSGGLDPADVHEPGAAWKPEHHRDPDVARDKGNGRGLRHWKTKMWKRRSAMRQARSEAARLAAES